MQRNMTEVRVAVIEPVGGHGGMSYYDMGLCEGVAKAGAEVSLYTCDIAVPASRSGVEVHPEFRRVFGSGGRVVRAMNFVAGLYRTLRGCVVRHQTVVHYHFFHYGLMELLSVVAAVLARRRVVVTVHDLESFDQRRLQFHSTILRLADAIIVHNRSSRKELVGMIEGIGNRVAVVPHGNYIGQVALEDRLTSRNRLGIPADARVLLFFGQIKDVKGLDVLIRAFARLHSLHPDLHLIIAGRPWKSDFSVYQSLIDELGVADRVHCFIRYVAESEVGYFYGSADVVVLPYRRIYQSGVLLMAMSLGLPVMASSLDAMREVVVSGENGWIFETDNVEALAECVSTYLGGNGSGQEGAAAASLMVREYGWASIGEKTLAIYKKVCGL